MEGTLHDLIYLTPQFLQHCDNPKWRKLSSVLHNAYFRVGSRSQGVGLGSDPG